MVHLDHQLLGFFADDLVAMIQQSVNMLDHGLDGNHLRGRGGKGEVILYK